MDFSYSDEQKMLQDSVSRFISKDYDFESRRVAATTERGYNESYWQLFAELGWLMVPFLEEEGGLGGSHVDLMIMMEEFGKGIVNEPFLATAVLAGGIISRTATAEQKEAFIGPIMSGELQLAFAYNEPQSRYNLADVACTASQQDDTYILNGHKSVVLNGAGSHKLIVVARTSGEQCDESGISLFIVDANAKGVRIEGYPTVDGHQGADIWLDRVEVSKENVLGELNQALPAIQYVTDRASLAICAEAVGTMSVSLERTVEYSKTRKQFKREIGQFQALQHRMAHMFVELEQARSILLMAALKMDANSEGDTKALSAAKSRIGKAARLISQESVQIHGGIGMTDELDVGHFFKRLTTFQYLFGSTDYHTQRFSIL